MRFNKKIQSGFILLKDKLFCSPIPLIVGWEITRKCNLRCSYCSSYKFKSKELDTKECLSLVDLLARLGCKKIGLTGGEPLLKKDIGKIISYIKSKNISISLNSNGVLVPSRINDIKGVDVVTLSLDGPEKIHDYQRGKGAYKQVIQAAHCLSDNKLPFIFATTITTKNIQTVNEILEISKRFDVPVAFSPVEIVPLGNKKINDLIPSEKEFKQAVYSLIKVKKDGMYKILNSLPALRELIKWPYGKIKRCAAGRIYFRIDAQGYFHRCAYIEGRDKNVRYDDPKILHKLVEIHKERCKASCWCNSTLELNQIYNLRVGSLLDVNKYF